MLFDVGLTLLSRLVYAIIDSQTAPTQGDIAQLLGVSPRGVRKAVGCLVKRGWVIVLSSKPNRYIALHRTPLAASGAVDRGLGLWNTLTRTRRPELSGMPDAQAALWAMCRHHSGDCASCPEHAACVKQLP